MGSVVGVGDVRICIYKNTTSDYPETLGGGSNFTRTSYFCQIYFNILTPNDDYSGRTAPLASKRCILYIIQQLQVLNILNMLYTLLFFLFKIQFVS